MPSGIVFNVLRGSTTEGHANMKDLIWITIPHVGRLYVQRRPYTLGRIEWEVLVGPGDAKEYLLHLGRLRVYLTPASALAAERR